MFDFITDTNPHLSPHHSANTLIHTWDTKTKTHSVSAWQVNWIMEVPAADEFDNTRYGAHRNVSCFAETPTDGRMVAGWGQYTHSCFHGCPRWLSTESGIWVSGVNADKHRVKHSDSCFFFSALVMCQNFDERFYALQEKCRAILPACTCRRAWWGRDKGSLQLTRSLLAEGWTDHGEQSSLWGDRNNHVDTMESIRDSTFGLLYLHFEWHCKGALR